MEYCFTIPSFIDRRENNDNVPFLLNIVETRNINVKQVENLLSNSIIYICINYFTHISFTCNKQETSCVQSVSIEFFHNSRLIR